MEGESLNTPVVAPVQIGHPFLEELQQRYFDRYRAFLDHGASLDHQEYLFQPDGIVSCMDERVLEGGVRRAGSLVYEWYLVRDSALQEGKTPEEAESMADAQIAAFCEEAEVTTLTSHSGCGALTLIYQQLFPGQVADPTAVEAFAQEATHQLAKRLNLNFHHIPAEAMQDFAAGHYAFGTYYVGAPVSFNPTSSNLPPGFIIARGFADDPAMALKEVLLSTDIAFGSHGHGSFFSEENPFFIALLGQESANQNLRQLEEEVQSVITRLTPDNQRRIRVVHLGIPATLAN